MTAPQKLICSTCGLRGLCLPFGMNQEEMGHFDDLVSNRRIVKKNQPLFSSEDKFNYIYAIRSGFFKSEISREDGRNHVLGFHMAGELLGLDGISTGRYSANVFALEDSHICAIEYQQLEQVADQIQALRHHFHQILSREIVSERCKMMMIGGMRADERVANFLINLAQRFAMRGFAQNEFYLKMTREEIGSFLGLKLETVSRTFSRLQENSCIIIDNKHVTITDWNKLVSLTQQE